MKILMPLFFSLLCCILCSSSETMAPLTSPRVVLVLALLFWARCEFFVRLRVDAVCSAVEAMCHAMGSRQADGHARETPVSLSEYHSLLYDIRCLNQTIVNLSGQQTLLREIRAGVMKSVRCSKDVLDRLDGCSRESEQCIETARRQLRRSSLSESFISVPSAPF